MVLVAAKRARRIAHGADPMVEMQPEATDEILPVRGISIGD
jgi:DNA-directed RNA polymerase subunit K/omega